MTDTIERILGVRAPTVYSPPKKTVVLPPVGVNQHLAYGVELEIEGLDEDPDRRMSRIVAGMQYHEDGSLRNNGGEYVTLPMRRTTLEYVLDQFFKKNKLTAENYSERCSVHIHANCTDLTLSQLKLVLVIYQIIERVLFNFIKDERDNNIFCVPWSETLIGTRLLEDDDGMLTKTRRWEKYTALNLIPLNTQGTIEFRHMAGTHDLERILLWADIIGSIFNFATKNEYTKVIDDFMGLNTSSAYSNFLQRIFPDGHIYDALAVGDYRTMLEDGVIGMKVLLATPPDKKDKKTPAYVFMDDMVAEAPRVRVNPRPAAPPHRAFDRDRAQEAQGGQIRAAAVDARPADWRDRQVAANPWAEAIRERVPVPDARAAEIQQILNRLNGERDNEEAQF